MVKLYKQAHNEIVIELVRHIENGSSDRIIQQEASLARQLQIILKDLDSSAMEEVEQFINDSHVEGQARSLLALGEAKTVKEATRNVSFSLFARQSVNRLIEDTFDDVLAITNRTDIRIKRSIRQASGEIMRNNAIQQVGYDTNRQQLMERLMKEGFSKKVTKDFKGVTDSAGRRWRLDSYVNMLVRTKMSQAYNEGIRTECIERGIDLAMISSHGAEDDCRYYEGMVISMTGATAGYLTFDSLRDSNKIFHPNCEHTLTPLRDISLLPQELQDKHEYLLKNHK